MWIQTYTGKAFYPLDPKLEDIDLADIVHALSQSCRFAGHCREFYSVAQHSVLVAQIVADLGGTPAEIFAALLHDAGEAYLVDIPRPVKLQLPDYKLAEKKLDGLLSQKFKVNFDSPLVKQADMIALATEARDIMGNPQNWSSLAGITPSARKVIPCAPAEAKALFMAAFQQYQLAV